MPASPGLPLAPCKKYCIEFKPFPTRNVYAHILSICTLFTDITIRTSWPLSGGRCNINAESSKALVIVLYYSNHTLAPGNPSCPLSPLDPCINELCDGYLGPIEIQSVYLQLDQVHQLVQSYRVLPIDWL